jgi:site-specific recombinase XerD
MLYKKDMHISQLIHVFIADVCAGKTNETPRTYESKLKRFAVYMDDNTLKLKSLSREHIEKFREQLQRQSVKRVGSQMMKGHLSPFTINTVMRTLKHFLRWAFHKGYLRDLSNFPVRPPPMPDPKAIDADNALALMYAAARLGESWERARNLALLYVMRDTGARLGAILNMDIDNLDLKAGKLFSRTKGDKPITLYINEPTIVSLRAWLSLRPQLKPTDRKVFTTFKGTGITRSGFYSLLNRLIDAAGLRGKGRVNAHSFRHAWARDALTAGEDLTRVSQTLGHSTVRVTGDYYARWTDGELKSAHAKYSPGAKLPMIKPMPENFYHRKK